MVLVRVKKVRREAGVTTDRDYVNGPAMHKAIKEWYESGLPDPPKEVVTAVNQICERLAYKRNFKDYTYIDDMVAEGKMACILAVLEKKYDPYKYDNPFGYFTRIAFNAFVSVIKIEHRETYIKHKSLELYMIDAHIRGEDIEDYKMDDSGRLEKLVNEFESKKVKKNDDDEDRSELDSRECEESGLESES
jgi:hypothetical protein